MEKRSILTFFISFISTFFVKKSLSYFLGKLLRIMTPKSLLFTAQLELFYQVYNIILLIESNSYYYCFCDKVPGYPENYRIDDFRANIPHLEQIKHSTKELVKSTRRLYADLFDIINFDETIVELWTGEFIFSGRSWTGEQWWVPLRASIYSIFIK